MKVKTPKEDPSIKAARDREERRADSAFIENTTELLDQEQRKRVRRFGKRSNAVRSATTGAGAASGGSAAGASGGSGGGSFDPGGYGGGFGGDSSTVIS